MNDKEYQHALDLMERGIRADERARVIKDFIVAYIKDEEQCCKGCQRIDDYCCIKCFGDRYLEQLKSDK